MTASELKARVAELLPYRSSFCVTVSAWQHGHYDGNEPGRDEVQWRISAFAPGSSDSCHVTKDCATAAAAFAAFLDTVLPAIQREAGIAAEAPADLAAIDV